MAWPSPTNRSAIANGKLFALNTVDGRSTLARRLKDIIAEITNDLGGASVLSEGQRRLIRRVATLALMAEAIEGDLIGEKEIDIDRYGAICDRLGRLA